MWENLRKLWKKSGKMWEIMEKNMGEPMGHCGQRWKMYGENCHFLGSEVSPFVDSDQWGNVLTIDG